MTAPEKPLYHTTRSESSFYNGCGKSDCKGERIRGFNTCIVHLSPEEAEQYVTRLQSGQDELVISAVTVDMNFVQSWVDRISISENGMTVVSVPLRMQDTVFVGGLQFNKTRFSYGVNLTKLTAYDVRMFGVEIKGVLRLEEANLENELTLMDEFEVGDLTMPGCQVKNFNLSRAAIVHGTLNARGLTATNSHMSDVEIRGTANFEGASLCDDGQSVYMAASFCSLVDFSGCNFRGTTHFGKSSDSPPSRFLAEAKFNGATFGSQLFGLLTMDGCIFEGPASFENAEILGAASFEDVRFKQAANLSNLKFNHAPYRREIFLPMPGIKPPPTAALTVCRTHFESSLSLDAEVDGKALITDLTYTAAAEQFSISSTDELRLSKLTLESFNTLAVSSRKEVVVNQVKMQGGGELRISGPLFSLTNFTCAQPVLVLSTADQDSLDGKTNLSTLKGTNCEGLTLSGFDYGETKFLDATKLDSLMITGEFTLRSTTGWRARRAILAEEADARASREHWNKLARISTESPTELRRLATVYRALRKGREDQKDKPGSADFYYGEMEMRRLSSPPSVERAILTLYWLISGYGLRAWRALALLATVILGSAVALSFFTIQSGDHPAAPSLGGALLFTAQSGLSLSGSADHYTPVAQAFQLALRIVVPALIALAALAVRARVKR